MSQEQVKGKGFTQTPIGTANAGETVAAPTGATELVQKLDAKVKVIHGANDQEFSGLVGQKVTTVKASLVDAFNIPADAKALVNGAEVADNYALQQNDVLEFIKQAGVKGTATPCF